jgi:hypothetical protein
MVWGSGKAGTGMGNRLVVACPQVALQLLAMVAGIGIAVCLPMLLKADRKTRHSM